MNRCPYYYYTYTFYTIVYYIAKYSVDILEAILQRAMAYDGAKVSFIEDQQEFSHRRGKATWFYAFLVNNWCPQS